MKPDIGLDVRIPDEAAMRTSESPASDSSDPSCGSYDNPSRTHSTAGGERSEVLTTDNTALTPDPTSCLNKPQPDPEITTQIVQLQDMVVEIKQGFSSALEALAQIQYGDEILEQKMANNKAEYELQLADVVQMLLTLKTEFGSVVGQLQSATDNQNRLQKHIEGLQYERDIMLEELERAGAISQHVRQKYHSGRARPNGLNRSSDSTTLSSLLERAHSAFGTPRSHNVSDRDSGVNTYREHGDMCSCGEVTPPSVNPMVQSYIAGLQDMSCQDTLGPQEHYDSDSSITAAANKSLDLSRSLGDKCAEIAMVESSDEEDKAGEEEEEEERMEEGSEDNKENNSTKNGDIVTEKIHPVDHSGVFAQPMTPKRMAPHERNTKEVQRLRVAREIMDTERKYCSNLWTILDLYVGPLLNSGILSAKEASIMFPSSMSTIYDHHCSFLQKLEERMTNWKYHSVLGDILCRFIESAECDLLGQYQAYVTDFPASLYQIRKSCKHTARFRKFLRVMQRHPTCEGLDIGSFMVTPIQRIPRYVLLLKQLLKYTDPEHPDFYYVENALERLGDFLNKLNDSIEYSMQIVGTEDTPKPKRKLRIGSFRSNNGNSQDPNSSRLNDTSMLGGDDHSILSTSTSASHGRFFNFSFLRDSFRKKQNQVQVNHSYSTPVHSQVPPINIHTARHLDTPSRSVSHSSLPAREHSFSQSRAPKDSTFMDNREQYLSQSYVNGNFREQSFSNAREQAILNRSLPVRPDIKRRTKHRRPKSDFECVQTDSVHDVGRSVLSEINESQCREESLKLRRSNQPRPHSMIDQMSDVSLRSSTVTSQTQWPGTTSQESLNTLTADTQTISSISSSRSRHKGKDHHGSTERVPQSAYEMSELAKSLPDVSTQRNGVAPNGAARGKATHGGAARSNSRKLPQVPVMQRRRNDYGIYGAGDDLDQSGYRRPLTAKDRVCTVDMGKVKSASQGDILNDKENGPSQHYINIALARSLTENHLDSFNTSTQPLPRTSTSLLEAESRRPKSYNAPDRLQSRPPLHQARPRSAKPRHVTLPREDSQPQVWDCNRTAPPSILDADFDPPSPQKQEPQLTPKKMMSSKRKKDKSSKNKSKDDVVESGDGEKDKKKGSIRDSIKSIFFRKRKHEGSFTKSPPCKQNVNKLGSKGSKTLEIAPLEEFPENGHQIYMSMATPYPAVPDIVVHSDEERPPREQDPPLESTVIVEPAKPQLETYCDENGDPCSAV